MQIPVAKSWNEIDIFYIFQFFLFNINLSIKVNYKLIQFNFWTNTKIKLILIVCTKYQLLRKPAMIIVEL